MARFSFTSIPINDDNLIECREMFTITIDPSSLPDRCTIGAFGNATIIIVDDDGK